MTTHSSVLAWKIPWTEELGGLQSTGHKESDKTERLRFHCLLCSLARNTCCIVVALQSLSHVPLFTAPWTGVPQALPSFTISQSLLKFMSLESVIKSLRLCKFLSFRHERRRLGSVLTHISSQTFLSHAEP